MSSNGYFISNVQTYEKISDNNIFVVYYDKNYYLYACRYNISGYTITAGTETQLKYSNKSGRHISTMMLDNSRVLITHGDDDTNQKSLLYGIICTMSSSTSFTKGTDTKLSTIVGSGYLYRSMTLMPNNEIFITYSEETQKQLYGMTITTSGATITKKVVDTLLTTSIINLVEARLIENNNTIIYWAKSGIYKIVCDSSISIKSHVKMGSTNERTSSIRFFYPNNNTIGILYTTNVKDIYIFIASVLTKNITLVTTSTDDIYGIAKDNGTEGQQIDVYRPYEEVVV